MGRSKKTRTKFTDAGGKSRNARREVAAEAARIIATEGQTNYHAAKKKAAIRVGVGDRGQLPSNLEVKDALLRYQELYGGQDHFDRIEQMRKSAISVMRHLEEFSPRLVGSVLDGTASAHSRIAMHVFCDSPDDPVFHFMERGWKFRQEQRQIRWHDGSQKLVPVFVIEFDVHPVELTVFQRVDLRQAPPSPIDGRPQQRATITEVEGLT
jgi:hypothetical protein